MASKRKLCDHCNEFVSLRTYRQHVDLYFNKSSKKWLKCGYETSSSDVDDHQSESNHTTLCDSGASHMGIINANDIVEAHEIPTQDNRSLNSQLRKYSVFTI